MQTVLGSGTAEVPSRVRDRLCRLGIMEDDLGLFQEVHVLPGVGRDTLVSDLLLRSSEFMDHPNEEGWQWVHVEKMPAARSLAIRRGWELEDVSHADSLPPCLPST